MRLRILALASIVGITLAASPVVAQQCPPGTEFIPAGYGKKAKWVAARCVPVYRPAVPSGAPAGAERATTRQLNNAELSRVQAR